MRNRRMVLAIFLLVAVFCIGSGFAAVTDILNIQGAADVLEGDASKAFDQHVFFSAAVAHVTGDSASIPDDNNDKATFTAKTLTGMGSTSTFTFTIKNDGDLIANITPVLKQIDNDEYFSVSSDWNGVEHSIAPNESETYTLTITMDKTPDAQQTCNIIVELNAIGTEVPAGSGG